MNSGRQKPIEFTDPSEPKQYEPHHDTEVFTDVEYSAKVFNVIVDLRYDTFLIENLVVPENRNKFLHFLKAMMRSKVFQEQWNFELDLDDSIYPRKLTKKPYTFPRVK